MWRARWTWAPGCALIGTLNLGLPTCLHLPLAILAGFLFGALYGGIIGFLKVRFGSNEVVAGVMMNTIATCIVGYLLNGPLLAEDPCLPRPSGWLRLPSCPGCSPSIS